MLKEYLDKPRETWMPNGQDAPGTWVTYTRRQKYTTMTSEIGNGLFILVILLVIGIPVVLFGGYGVVALMIAAVLFYPKEKRNGR